MLFIAKFKSAYCELGKEFYYQAKQPDSYGG